jgi:hypothetical protein
MSNEITSQSQALPIASLLLFLLGIVLLVLLFVFEPALRLNNIPINREFTAWAGLGCEALASVFGLLSWHFRLGKIVCIMAGLVTIGLLIWAATPIKPHAPAPIESRSGTRGFA